LNRAKLILSSYFLAFHLLFAYFAGCVVGDLAGPVIVAVCADKVLHLNL